MYKEIANRISKNYRKLWIWSFISVPVLIIVFATGFFILNSEISGKQIDINLSAAFILSLTIVFVFFIVTVVYFIKFLYNVWRTVAKNTDKVGSGWRVALLFIPFVNVIWPFFFYVTFAKRANEELSKAGSGLKMGLWLPIFFCIINLISNLIPTPNIEGGNPLFVAIVLFAIMALAILYLALFVAWIVKAKHMAVELAFLKEKNLIPASN